MNFVKLYAGLIVTSFFPAVLAMIFIFAENKTAFGKLDNRIRQIIYGVLFGALAIFGTEYGIPINGAQVNCRDVAVLTAGLIFGAPAGILAGLIGGIERWIAVAWGIGTFTRVACTVSTIFAGFYAALIRIYLLEDKRTGWLISFAVGVVMEVIHMTMVFLTNMATPEEAMSVVAACAAPMIIANSFSVLLASMVTSLITTLTTPKDLHYRGRGAALRISQSIQRWLLVTVILAFITTSFFLYRLQNGLAEAQTDDLLSLALDETVNDIRDASDDNILELANKISGKIMFTGINAASSVYDVAEINIIDANGIIVESTFPDYIGYDMASGEQSAAFLCLLNGEDAYVQEYGPTSFDKTVSRKYAAVPYNDGFLQIGYNADEFQSDLDYRIIGITKNSHVGRTGYILIIDSLYHVVSGPPDFDIEKASKELAGLPVPEEDTTFHATINSEKCFLRYRTAEGFYIFSVLPESEGYWTRDIALYVNTFLEVIVFAVMFGLIYLLIDRIVVNRLKSVNASLSKISGGNLNEIIDVRSNEEFSFLSDDINRTVDTLKQYISEASARIDKELEFAKSIQHSALPNTFPAFPKRTDFDIYALMDPAKEVGGDFYDFYLTDSGKLNFLIADVSGKGIPAAMFMMRAKTELKSLSEMDLPIDEVFSECNKSLCEGNDAGMFVTAWQGCIDLSTGLVAYANAGHNPPLVRHEGGSFEYLHSKPGFVLAGLDTVKYRPQELALTPGDVVFLYTDGVTEATDASNTLYGEGRLLAAVNSHNFDTMQALCEFVKADVDAFVGSAPQFDDITMLALKYKG